MNFLYYYLIEFMTDSLNKTNINGVYEIELNRFEDDRGSFLNIYKSIDNKLTNFSINSINQINLSLTRKTGTIRGLHLQNIPYQETKLITCLKGKVFDVAVDFRRNSPTYLKWHSIELESQKFNAIIIPEGCAHGFQTLEKDCELLYLHSNDWIPSSEMGVKYNDPNISIKWPMECTLISKKDSNLPFLESSGL